MAGIEFTSRLDKVFTIVVRDPLDAYAILASGIGCTEIAPGRYRASLGVLTGLVWIEATDGAVKALGFADLDSPASNGYSEVLDSEQVAGAGGIPSGAVVDTIRDGKTLWVGFVGETSKTVATPDYTATVIKVVIEHKTSGASYTVNPTKTSTTITFAVPAEVYGNVGEYIYAIKLADDFVLHHGDYLIKRTAI